MCGSNWLEHSINPFPEAVLQTTDVGADRSSGPVVVFHAFVDFVGDVELAIRVLLVI